MLTFYFICLLVGLIFAVFSFIFSGAAATLAIVATGAALGMLPAAFETTILHTIEHEAHYTTIDFWKYAAPFVEQTPLSSGAILFFAAYLLACRSGGFWGEISTPFRGTFSSGSWPMWPWVIFTRPSGWPEGRGSAIRGLPSRFPSRRRAIVTGSSWWSWRGRT